MRTTTQEIFAGLDPEAIGPGLHEVIATQVALNALGEGQQRDTYAPSAAPSRVLVAWALQAPAFPGPDHALRWAV